MNERMTNLLNVPLTDPAIRLRSFSLSDTHGQPWRDLEFILLSFKVGMAATTLTPSKPSSSTSSGPKREVSESALDYLSIELVSAMLAKASNANTSNSSNSNISNNNTFESAAYDIEMLGFRVGQRIAEKCICHSRQY